LWPHSIAGPRAAKRESSCATETPYPNRDTAKPMAITQLMSVRPMVQKQPRSATATCSLDSGEFDACPRDCAH
jgi:hypothetical protein